MTGVVVLRGVSGREGVRVGTIGAEVVACIGERFVGSEVSPVAVRSAAEDACMALRLAGPGSRLYASKGRPEGFLGVEGWKSCVIIREGGMSMERMLLARPSRKGALFAEDLVADLRRWPFVLWVTSGCTPS